jgi:RimJ/RimL family protein N-acetyltransferase
MHVYLKTERVSLRQYQPEDFDRLVELNSDPEVMKYLGGLVANTVEDTKIGVERTLQYQKQFNFMLGVFTAEINGEFIGWFLLRPDRRTLDNTKELEVGYRLKKKFWGQGYATEVSSGLIKRAFEELDAEIVFGLVSPPNIASRKVLEKVGLRFIREYDDPLYRGLLGTTARYELTRAEWQGTRAAFF